MLRTAYDQTHYSSCSHCYGSPLGLISQVIAETFPVAVQPHLRAWDVITDLCESLMQNEEPTLYSTAPIQCMVLALLHKHLLSCSHILFKPQIMVLKLWLSEYLCAMTFPRALQRVVKLHTLCRKAFLFLNFPRHFFIGHEIHRLMIKL